MGTINHYKCQNCGYEVDYSTGRSGITDHYILAFVCDKIKDVVQVSSGSGRSILFASSSNDVTPIPKNPVCPVCKDHNLSKEWLGGACPKCGEYNSSAEVDSWD